MEIARPGPDAHHIVFSPRRLPGKRFTDTLLILLQLPLEQRRNENLRSVPACGRLLMDTSSSGTTHPLLVMAGPSGRLALVVVNCEQNEGRRQGFSCVQVEVDIHITRYNYKFTVSER